MLDIVKAWIKSHEMDPDLLQVMEDGKQAQVKYNSSRDGKTYSALLDIDLDKEWVELFLYLPGCIPEKRRRAVAELLALINPGLRLGNLDVLITDGRVRFRCGADVEGCEIAETLFDNMDALACSHLDKHYPAIMAVGFAGQNPERALAELRGDKAADGVDPDWLAEEELPGWDDLPNANCLRQWAGEIKSALESDANAEEWSLVGHGATIECDDMERAERILRRVAHEAGMKFASIPKESVLDLPVGSTDPFRSLAPLMVYLELGSWMQLRKNGEEETEETERADKFRQQLKERLKGFDPAHPVLYTTSAYDVGDIAESLLILGALDRRFTVVKPDNAFLAREFMEKVGGDACGDSFRDSLDKVGAFASWHDSRERDLLAIFLKRLARREKRKVEFIDLVNIDTRGYQETDALPPDAEPVRRQTAYHEAGHALVAMLDSQGKNIPEYSTIVASGNFKGVMVISYAFHSALEANRTYRDFRHDVRISLAGRAGEQLLVGAELVSVGAYEDLKNATWHSRNAFGRWGFVPEMEDGNTGSNLSVIIGDASPSENAHLEEQVRSFLADQYRYVLDLLTAHRSLLTAIADRLMWDTIVDRDELLILCGEHGIRFDDATI